MKMVSTLSLGIALALGGVAVIGTQPAVAQKQKKGDQPKFDLSKPVREAAGAAQAALGDPNAPKDIATAQAKAAEAVAAATTPDDRYVANSIAYDVARATKDPVKQAQALDGMIASGKVPAANVGQFNLVRGNLAYQAKDFARAEAALDAAVKAGVNSPDVTALLVESKAGQGKNAEALAALEQAVATADAAGRPLPEAYYGRGISIGYKAKLAGPVERLTQSWLKNYPKQDNWRDALITYRDLNKLDAEQELDMWRLLRTAKALKGEADYYQYAEAVYLKFPGEGKAVIDEGVAAGMLQLKPNSNIKSFYDTSSSRQKADKADLPAAAASAAKAANGVAARATADSYLGYGDYAKAAELYRLALQKGGVDANVVNTRLGMALARQGQKDQAKQVFSQVTGPRQALAKYWIIYLDTQA